MSKVLTPGLRLINNNDYEPASDAGKSIQHTWAQQRNYLSKSASDWLPTLSAALRAIQNNCGRPNWDGAGAMPVVDLTVALAATVVTTLFRQLSKGTPSPDVIPEPDGEICISWTVDSTRVFSLSVGVQDKINFAGQFGNEGSVHGWQPIDAKSTRAIEASLADVVRYISRLFTLDPVRSAA